PTARPKMDGEQDVFRQASGRQATHCRERRASNQRASAAKKTEPATVARWKNAVEEQTLIIGNVTAGAERAHHRIVVVEMVRSLGDRHRRVRHCGHQPLDGKGVSEKVGVEHQNELAVGLSKRVIDVARFRALVIGTGEPFRPQTLAKCAEPWTASVVEYIHRYLAAPLDASARENGALEDLGAFVER